MRVGAYGPPLTNLPDEAPIDASAVQNDVVRPMKASVENLRGRGLPEGMLIDVNSALIAPIRTRVYIWR